MLVVSTDLVFPGRDGANYVEHDTVAPLNAYGRAKAHAERAVLSHAPDSLVIRSAGMFGPWDDDNFIAHGMALLRKGEPWPAAHDHVLSPTYTPDLVQSALDLLIDGERGRLLPSLDDALSRYQQDHEATPTPPPPLRAAA